MPRRKVADNGLIVAHEISPDLSRDEGAVTAEALDGFENLVRGVEAWARPHAGSRAHATKHPLSAAAYGYWICFNIDLVRRLLREPPRTRSTRAHTAARVQLIATLAYKVGFLHAEARALFNWGELARTGLRRRRGQRTAGRKSGVTRRGVAGPRNERIAARAREIRLTEKYHRRDSPTKALAERLRRELKLNLASETIRELLPKMGIR